MIAAEKIYSINYAESGKNSLSLYNNGAASYLFVNGVVNSEIQGKRP